jgi:hypothetical protein
MIQKFEILTQSSPLYYVLCAGLGFFYAFIFYKNSLIENKITTWILASFRFLVVSIICFLLLSPMVKTITNEFEKPIFLIALDNSESVGLVYSKPTQDSIIAQLKQLVPILQKKEAEVHFKTLDNQTSLPEHLPFKVKSTNYSTLLADIENEYENRNLVEVILAGDGIINEGVSPAYKMYPFKISTIALGDTTPKKDIAIKGVVNNKTTFLGNKFPIEVQLNNDGFKNTSVNVSIVNGQKIIAQQNITLGESHNEIQFLLDATQKGMQHYTINVKPIKGEYTLQNNQRHVYIEVIDGKEKILLIAATPHPDIKAIKSTLENIDNIELSLYIPEINTYKDDKYDLIILHQIPNLQGIGNEVLQKVMAKNTSLWFILGNQSDLNRFNGLNTISKIMTRGRTVDKVAPYFNPGFDKFEIEDNFKKLYPKLPPLSVPFGDIQLNNSTATMLYQKIGNVNSTKPLLVYSLQTERKIAVLFGEGIWQWRMVAYEQTQSHEAFDLVFSKFTQLLSQKVDKRKFRVYPIENEILNTERVVFETEVYNAVFEPIYGQKVNLEIKSEAGKKLNYSYILQKDAPRFDIENLPQGIYKFTASTMLDGKKEISQGEFTVKELQLEVFNTTANHQLLRDLSKKSGGTFVTFNNIDQLAKSINASTAKQKIHSSEDLLEIIHLKWIFFLILTLVSAEWIIRKALGTGV